MDSAWVVCRSSFAPRVAVILPVVGKDVERAWTPVDSHSAIHLLRGLFRGCVVETVDSAPHVSTAIHTTWGCYPLPATSASTALAAPVTCSSCERGEFMGITGPRTDARSTYPHYPPPLLLSAAISLINHENRSENTEHITRSHDPREDIHSRAGIVVDKTAHP